MFKKIKTFRENRVNNELINLVTRGQDIKQFLTQHPRIDINFQNDNGRTALMIAACYSNTDSLQATVDSLIQAGANLDLQDSGGWTALMMAARYSNRDSSQTTIDSLIQAGANLNLQDSEGWTTLMLSARYSNADSSQAIVDSLIQAGANLDLQNSNGWTALIMAARYSNADSSQATVDSLIQAGANLDLQNSEGNTVLKLAILVGSQSVNSLTRAGNLKLKNTNDNKKVKKNKKHKKKIISSNKYECAICFVKKEQFSVNVRCGHIYCSDCFTKTKVCPQCRAGIALITVYL